MAITRSGRTGLIAGLVTAMAATPVAMGQLGIGGQSQPRSADELLRVETLSDADRIGPGQTFHLIIRTSVERNWHVYWKNPGEGAMAPQFQVEAPDGFEVGEPIWPRPVVIDSNVGKMFAYKDELAVFVPVTAPPTLEAGEARFTVSSRWAVCDDELCFFGQMNRSATIETTSEAIDEPQSGRHAERIKRWREALPTIINDETDGARLMQEPKRFVLEVPSTGGDEVMFLPHESPGVRYRVADVERKGDHLRVTIDLSINAANFRGGPPRVGGLLAIGNRPTDPSYEFSRPIMME